MFKKAGSACRATMALLFILNQRTRCENTNTAKKCKIGFYISITAIIYDVVPSD